MANTNGRGKKPRASKNADRNPNLLVFALELALCGGNASEAGRRLGWSGSYARDLANKHPEVIEDAKAAVQRVAESKLGEWAEMQAEARRTIGWLMRCADDDRVRLQAAKFIIERVEGKAAQTVAVDGLTPEDVLASATLRFVFSYMVAYKVPIRDAMAYAEANPVEVRRWAVEHGLLESGT